MKSDADLLLLAHGAGGGADELFLMAGLGGIVFGAVHLLDKRRSMRRRLLVGLPLIVVGLFVGASPFIFGLGVPQQAAERIASPARVEILQPAPGATVSGESMQLRVRVVGARVVSTFSSDLDPTVGHLHLSLDGRRYGTDIREVQTIDISQLDPGAHLIEVEFVATDDGPFEPPVKAVSSFTVER